MLLHELVETSLEVGRTAARLAKVDLLARVLARLAPEETEIGVAFLSGETGRGRIGIGWSGLRAATGEPASAPSLDLRAVALALEEIERARGAGSAAARNRLLGGLFARATAPEQEFLRRLLLGELRQGAQEGVLVEAIARAARVDAASVRRAVMLAGDSGAVAAACLREGAAGLARFSLELFRPIQPMLAQTAADATEAFARTSALAVEDKLDGARVQIHRDGDQVRVFSRRSNDVSAAVPELVERVASLPVRRIVLDGEAIALDGAGRPLPFQTTMRRLGRRLDIERLRDELPLSAFFFDCLHLDGEDLIDRGAADRWRALAGVVPADATVARAIAHTPAEVDALAGTALARGHEGVMLKALDATYEAGRRGASWLKLKPTHTLDLVVLAAEWGSGRRTGWLSNLHLGARDPAAGAFVMLGKTFKGMTDEMLRWQTRRLLELELGREGHVVHVRPELVVEIAFDGVQTSPQYPGGVALRFARVKRYREDKLAGEADTIDAVRAIHARSASADEA